MLKQLEKDGTITIVLSKDELVAFQPIFNAAVGAHEMGLTNLLDPEFHLMGQVNAAVYMLSDEEIAESLMAPHADHVEDNHEAMRKMFTKAAAEGRANAIEIGLIAG